MVCGNVLAMYTVLFHHKKTNTYIRMGQDCAAKCDMAYDENAFKHWKARFDSERELRAGKTKAKALLADNGATGAWDIYEDMQARLKAYQEAVDAWNEANPNAEAQDETYPKYPKALETGERSIILDMVNKLIRYGSLSEKQFKFLRVLIDKHARAEEIAAARKAEADAALPVPAEMLTGRVKVEGTVLTVKGVETDFGFVTKMLVKADAGWKVWSTVPGGIAVERGQRVTFDARLQKSKDDPKFAFASRPTKLTVLQDAVVKEAA
jgi:hypothetical protein